MQGFLDQIKKLAQDVSAQQGCRLYDIDFVGGAGGRTLRVFIDRTGEGGASIEDCSKVSRGMNEILDANEEMIPGGNYNLEVSTPGLERTLREPWHFEGAMGTKISVKTFAPILDFNPNVPALGKAKTLAGVLTSFDDKDLRLTWNDAEIVIPRVQLTKAHVVFEFEEPQKDHPKKNKHKNNSAHPKAQAESQGAAKK